MTTPEEFFQAHAVDGVLSDEKMGELLLLPTQADSGAPPPQPSEAAAGSKAPAAAPAAQAKAGEGGSEGGTDSKTGDKAGAVDESQLNAQNAVILAKDGKHTISFEKLEEARERAKVAEDAAAAEKAESARLRGELEKAQKAPPAQGAAGEDGGDGKPAGEADKPAAVAGVDFGDYSDAAIASAVNTLVDKRVAGIKAELLAPQAEAAETKAVEDHYTPIYAAHPDADSIAESTEFKAWKEAQPTIMRKGIEAALAEGTAQDVVDVFSTYKQATGKTGGAGAGDGKAKADSDADAKTLAAAEQAIADAKAKPPTSLTEIPAGTSAHHDEADAVLARSSTQLMTQFEGKSPDEIMKLMDRTL